MHRKTQTAEFWTSFQPTAQDIDLLSNHLLDSGSPKRATDLARLLIQQHVENENAALRIDLTGQTVYQPNKQFRIGELLVFPALNFLIGKVIAQRPGHNPELGDFDVVKVEMTSGRTQEFAANLVTAHRLNDLAPSAFTDEAALLPATTVADLYTEPVAAVINNALEKHSDFIRIKDEWFLRAMMAEVNVGHLNLAEAVLDMANGGPLTTDVLLHDLGLPPDITGGVQEASLNAALAHDDRFDEVSLSERPAWFLRRLEPAEVRTIPAPLVPAHFDNSTVQLSEELQALARELSDELAFDDDAAAVSGSVESTSVVLTFAHRRAGTLGWSHNLAGVLPHIAKPRIPITFRDKVNGKNYTVWMVKDGRYIYGLAEWYKQHEIPAGAYIELSRGPVDSILFMDFKRRRPRREWVRVATNRDGHLRLETAQRAVSCEFDELMAIFVDDARALDAVRGAAPRGVAEAVREAFPEIAKLSPQGNVHARTLYAAVNVVTRAKPQDVFAALVSAGNYVPVGDNYWHLGD
jgi:hypothetical protein